MVDGRHFSGLVRVGAGEHVDAAQRARAGSSGRAGPGAGDVAVGVGPTLRAPTLIVAELIARRAVHDL